jgi:hypothetical protein
LVADPLMGAGSQCDSLNITIYDTGVKRFLDMTFVPVARADGAYIKRRDVVPVRE